MTTNLSQRTAVPVAPLTVLLPDDVTAPARARYEVRSMLLGAGLEEAQLDDVLLATSELVTNAFEHGECPQRLELSYFEGQLTLRVHDSGSRPPQLRAPSPAQARSRGLVLVEALSEDWGFEPCPGGKFVWAVFRIPGA